MDLERRVAVALAALGIDDRDRLAVACSGGADSIALAHLTAHRPTATVLLHVDHGLRDDSYADADLVSTTAQRLGSAFLERRVTVEPIAGSLEAGARQARYAALEQMAEEAGARFVATAHTLDDQAETVLLRVLRGGALDAISPVRGRFVRPLLDVPRAELREWLTRNGIGWHEDPTNTDERFERNWLRRLILPQLEQRRPGVATAIARVARRAHEDRAALDAFAADVFSRASIDDVGLFLHADDLDLAPAAVAVRVIRSAFRHLGSDPTTDVVDRVREMRAGHARHGGIDVWRLADGIAFVTDGWQPQPITLPHGGNVESTPWGIRVRVGPSGAAPWRWRARVPAGVGELTIRERRPGDRVTTRAGTKKVQDVLVDAKVPRPLRGLVPILDAGGVARAVVGHGACRGPSDVSGTVVDVEPFEQTWSRKRAWISR